MLILRGANVELASRIGSTPLASACCLNLQSTVHALIQAGADVNRTFESNWTPLIFAATEGHVGMAQKLLYRGADPSRVDHYHRRTARDWAKELRHGGVVRMLDTSGSILVVRSAEQVRRLATNSALRFLPKDLCRMIGLVLF
jgi:ankyrin repeat domain-containing protein 17